jgi:hypothetical protein
METILVARRTFKGNAVQITEDNIYELAKWCGGRVDDYQYPFPRLLIEVRRGACRQIQGRYGDWLMEVGLGFYIYSNKKFREQFEELKPEGKKKMDRSELKQKRQIIEHIAKELSDSTKEWWYAGRFTPLIAILEEPYEGHEELDREQGVIERINFLRAQYDEAERKLDEKIAAPAITDVYAAVHKQVQGVMTKQDLATYYSSGQGEMGLIATQATVAILEIFGVKK